MRLLGAAMGAAAIYVLEKGFSLRDWITGREAQERADFERILRNRDTHRRNPYPFD